MQPSSRDFLEYQKAAFMRAWKDTWEYSPINQKQALFTFITLVTTWIVAILLGLEQEVLNIIGLLAVVLPLAVGAAFLVAQRCMAPVHILQEVKDERDQLQRRLDELTTPKLEWEWREANTKYLIREGDHEVSIIYLRNTSMTHVEKIEVFSDDAVPLESGDFVLSLSTARVAPQLRLSHREPVPVRILVFNAASKEIICLLPFRSARDEQFPGKVFSLKFMIVGTTPAGVAISSPRIIAKFGVDHNNKFFVSYAEANPGAQ